jgi:hypothetical protein
MQVAAAIVQRVAGGGFPVKFFMTRCACRPTSSHEAAKTAARRRTRCKGRRRVSTASIIGWTTSSICRCRQSGVLPETAFHEAFHRLQNLGVFSGPEVAVMQRERKNLERYIERELGLREGATAGFPQYEINAYAFGLWATAREGQASPVGISPIHATIRRAFDRLWQLLRAVRNALEGFGLRTSQGVFDAARRGEMARRIEATGAKPGDYKQFPASSFATMSRARQDEIERMNAMAGMPPRAPGAARPPSFQTPAQTTTDRVKGVIQHAFVRQEKINRAIEAASGPIPEPNNPLLAQTVFSSRTQNALERFGEREVQPLYNAIASPACRRTTSTRT